MLRLKTGITIKTYFHKQISHKVMSLGYLLINKIKVKLGHSVKIFLLHSFLTRAKENKQQWKLSQIQARSSLLICIYWLLFPTFVDSLSIIHEVCCPISWLFSVTNKHVFQQDLEFLINIIVISMIQTSQNKEESMVQPRNSLQQTM